ncbi:MAG TPA: HNH endonuclease [Candidatus Binatus sp.]|nr:HNH endonuclease [Candidatus Binatus sp.]
MRDKASEAMVGERAGGDFLFTWKEKKKGHPDDRVRKAVETFRSKGIAEIWWRCDAIRKVRLDDRAYLLKQGKPKGIFGRGTVIGLPRRNKTARRGEGQWQVKIRFDASQGDVLTAPESFLAEEKVLLSLPVPKEQWERPASGTELDSKAARAIDTIIDSKIPRSLLVGSREIASADDSEQQVDRYRKLIEQLTRPEQRRFREKIRELYRNKCAVTGCITQTVLEAAHISTRKGVDDNSPQNGILLRADVHALFDSFLIALSEDGTRLEVSSEVTDPSYEHLKNAIVARPDTAPSVENIRHHRERFHKMCQRRIGSGKLGHHPDC